MDDAEPVVRVAAGDVRGRVESGVAVFRGIPFAEPRVRFGAPEPVEAWAGVRDVSTFGSPPPLSGLSSSPAGWLTVNVWSPDLAGDLPVMVWIQGGGYVSGTSGLPEYDGARLAADGVVLVTFNYRVGVEGFAQVDGAPANRGLLDQVAALEWVRDNIAAFGGNPRLVTVFGESAGAGCVAALLAMPRAEGLFRRAIVQSMPGTYFTPELAADIGSELVAEVGSPLADVPPDELPVFLDALTDNAFAYVDRWGLVAHRKILLAPVVDGDVLPVTPWEALAAGAAADIDLIVGHTANEHRLFMLLDGTLGSVTEELAAEALRLFAPDDEARYRATGAGPEELYEMVHSDWLFRLPTLRLAEAHNGRTFAYELTWPARGLGGVLGACHGLDVPLVFGNLTAGQPATLLGDDLTDAKQISTHMREAWTSFATTGDPGWPEFGPPARHLRLFRLP